MKRRAKKPRRAAEIDATGLRTILDSMVEAVFVVDDSGRIALTNRALDELLARDVRGTRPKKLIRSDDLRLAVRRARKQRVATETQIEGEIGDRTLTFQVQVSPLPGRAGVVVVLHDVSKLKSADRVRRDFVANAAHELRTPLAAIRGYAETLVNGVADPAVARSFLEGILRQSERLQRLADDLASLSRAESAERGYEASPTDVGRLCADVVATLAPMAAERDIRLRLALPRDAVVVTLSARALEEILVNLVENAIKYSNPGGEVEVSMRVGSRLHLDVTDHGIGIPARYHQRVFERFFRVDKGRSRQDGGSGLGLAIVRHLVTRMGGSVAVESAPGEGSRFKLTLPLSR